MKKRKFSRTGLVLVGSMVICLLICLAVLIPRGGAGGPAAEDLNDENTPDLKTVVQEGTPLLIYDKRPEAQALLTAYEAGALEEAWVQIGAGEKRQVTTPSEVKELYRLLKNVVVTGEAPDPRESEAADESEAPDGNIEATALGFVLADGDECTYVFAGNGVLAIDDATFAITGEKPLFEKLEKLK